jgi:hypothetical protein
MVASSIPKDLYSMDVSGIADLEMLAHALGQLSYSVFWYILPRNEEKERTREGKASNR